jgi:hypothetical protein
MKEVKMTFIEIGALYNAINAASAVKFNAKPKFRYALAKNMDTLETHMRALREAGKLPEDDEDIKAHEDARKALVKEFDKTGRQVPPAKMPEFLDKWIPLRDEKYQAGKCPTLFS